MRGAIGALSEGGHADVDYFRVPVGKGARVVRARLEGVPGVDLVLELFDAQGRRLAKSDEHGRGGSEWLQPTSIGPSEAFLAVREVWVEGQKPTEDPNETYALTGDVGAAATGWEIEPNDWEAAATPVPPGHVDARLPGRRRRQGLVRRHAGDERPRRVRVSVPAGVDVVLLAGRRRPSKTIDEQAGRAGRRGDRCAAEAGRSTSVGVARRPHRQEPEGRRARRAGRALRARRSRSSSPRRRVRRAGACAASLAW